jgi:hypothetical protein
MDKVILALGGLGPGTATRGGAPSTFVNFPASGYPGVNGRISKLPRLHTKQVEGQSNDRNRARHTKYSGDY